MKILYLKAAIDRYVDDTFSAFKSFEEAGGFSSEASVYYASEE